MGEAGEVEPSQPIPAREVERMMKLQDVLLKAMASKLSWVAAAEIIGVTPRTMRRWRARLQEHGYSGLRDGRKGKPSFRRVPLETCQQVLRLYQETYFDFNVRHFHEKLAEQHGIELSYTWVKQALQGAGLVPRHKKRGKHRRRRPRREMPGMLLHIDGSTHRWFQDDRYYDLIVILDDATSEIYYAQLVEQESTRTVMAGLKAVIERQGVFCALYSDRAGHFFHTPKAGQPVDRYRPTQLGRALRELSIQMIPSYSPQARGRMERSYWTWQGRLPQELRLHQITTLEAANQFLREHYTVEFNHKFAVKAALAGTAFRARARRDLDWIFSIQTERVVSKDNTVAIADRWWQLEKSRFRPTLAGQTVTIHEHLDGTVSIRFGPHLVGRYDDRGEPIALTKGRGNAGSVEAVENPTPVSHRSHRPLEIASGDSHLSTASTIRPLPPKPKAKRVA
jgi:transposase